MSPVWDTDNLTCEAYQACSKCGERFDDLGSCTVQQTRCNTYRASITVDDHTYSSTREISTGNDHTCDSGEVTKAATCKKTGTMLYTCTTCGATKEEEISRPAHSYDTSNGETHYKALSDGIEDCTLGGYTIYTCSLCGEQMRKNNIDEVDSHTCGTPTLTKSSDGNMLTYTCTVCGWSYTTEETHNFEEISSTEATCTSTGEVTYRCSICGEQTTDITAAFGHAYSSSSVSFTWSNLDQDFTVSSNLPSCTYEATCTRCENKVSGNCVVSSTEYTAPTTTVAGSRTFKAQVSGLGSYDSKISATKEVSIEKIAISSTEGTIAEKKSNKITAKNVYASYSTKKQTVSLGAKATGGTLAYKSSNKNVTVSKSGKVTIAAKFSGSATITITAKDSAGKYKNVTKKIKVTVPKAASVSSLKNSASKKAALKWKKISGISGYQIQYAAKKDFSGKKTITVSSSKTSTTLTGLKKGTTEYVRIRTYKTVSGKKYYSAWSAKKVKIKK